MIEIMNGKITNTVLGEEDHGIFTAMIMIDMGGTCGGFGGYALDQYDEAAETRMGTAYGMQFIKEVLKVLRVDKWESLKGTYLRVGVDGMRITQIGHLIENRWFDPVEFSRRYQ